MRTFTSVINYNHFSEDKINQVVEQSVGKPIYFGGPFYPSAHAGRIGVITSAERIENTNDVKFEFEAK